MTEPQPAACSDKRRMSLKQMHGNITNAIQESVAITKIVSMSLEITGSFVVRI